MSIRWIFTKVPTPESSTAPATGVLDVAGFRRELDALRQSVQGALGREDLRHLRKIEWWGRGCTLLGYATAWILPNPLSAALISQGSVTRWTVMMHHVGHGAYDRVPGVPARYTSKVFGRGWRRFIDFPDWVETESWLCEHNLLHHYHTGEAADPDLVERNITTLRRLRLARPLKLLIVLLHALTWKWSYYAPSNLRALHLARTRPAGTSLAQHVAAHLDAHYQPQSGRVRALADVAAQTLWRCILPYALYRFALIPALFLIISPEAALNVLWTSILAELITSVHTFLIIGPNHCGDDLQRFATPPGGKAEFYLRQLRGSANYRTGGDGNDFLHGWLNYQIEHHLWPDLPLLRYQQLQPQLRQLCARHGVPYVQEGVLRRARRMIGIMIGERSMLRA